MSEDGKTNPFGEIAALIAERKTAPEDEWNVRNKALRAAERDLQGLFADPERGSHARKWHADIAMVLEQWHEAKARWRDAADFDASLADYGHCRVAECCRHLAEIDAARTALNAVSAEYRSSLDFSNEDRRVLTEADNLSAIEKSFAAFEALAAEGDFRRARMLVREAAVLRRHGTAELSALDQICDGMQAFHDGVTLPRPAMRSGQTRKLAFVGGFGWSGSGAVAAYLGSFRNVSFPVQHTELTLFEEGSVGGYNLRQILRASASHAPDAWRRAAIIFVLWTVLGLVFPPATPLQARRWHRKSLAKAAEGSFVPLVDPILAFLALCEAKPPRRTALIRAVAAIFESAAAADDGIRILGLENSIHAKNMAMLHRFQDAVGFAVWRDPRDQFVARATENRFYAITVDKFIARLERDRERFAAALQKDAARKRIHQVQFEDFVTRPEVRSDVALACGLESSLPDGDKRFDVARSLKNIGIHRHFEDQTAIAAVAAAFPDLLWKRQD